MIPAAGRRNLARLSGVVAVKLNALKIAKATGDIPENILRMSATTPFLGRI